MRTAEEGEDCCGRSHVLGFMSSDARGEARVSSVGEVCERKRGSAFPVGEREPDKEYRCGAV